MKKILISSAVALLLGTSATMAENAVDKAGKILLEDQAKYGTFHLKVAKDYMALSEAYEKLGKFDESIEYALYALKVDMKLLKEDDPKLAKLYFNTGRKYYKYKQHPTAMLYMEKAASIYKNGSDKESLALADTYEAISSIYINLDDYKKSLEYSEKTLDIRQKKLGKNDEAVKRTEQNIEFIKQELAKKKQ
jgi:tetratricopeptide (TPR) repeat protein